jgi:hypothetical protein
MNADFAIISKEANHYRSQGLHEKALEVYARFIVCSGKLDPGMTSSIKKQIQLIELEMNGADPRAAPRLSAGGIFRTKKSSEASAVASDLFVGTQGQAPSFGCSPKDESGIKGLNWADGMLDVYALVSNDRGPSSSESLERNPVFFDTAAPKMRPDRASPQAKRFLGDYAIKPFLKSIVAFILVGGIFFYFVEQFSEANNYESAAAAPMTAAVVFKNISSFMDEEHASALPEGGVKDHGPILSEELDVIEIALPAVDPVATPEAVRHLLSPAADTSTANKTPSDDFKKDGTTYSEMPAAGNSADRATPNEPDPAALIDYVLKKRRL